MQVLRSIRRAYVVALALIALLTIASHALLDGALVRGEHDGALINVAGRQRMLSQRIARCALAVGGADARIALERALGEFRSAHDELLGHPSTGPDVRLALDRLERERERLVRSAESILAAPPGQPRGDDVATVLAASDRLLPRMHEVVGMYQAAAHARVQGTEALALGLGGLTLLVLALECLFVFEPLRRTLHGRIRDLQQTRNQAERAVQSSERFLSTVSHEIRTPLNGVIGMDELMRHTDLDTDQLDLVDTLNASATTLKDLLNDVLDFAKMSGGASVRSRQGAGTCSTVDIAMEMHGRTVPDDVERAGVCDLSGKTVWVVDDHPVSRRYMRALMERWDARFRAFEDAKTFEIGCARIAVRPDVILLDHQLPGRSGVDIARALGALLGVGAGEQGAAASEQQDTLDGLRVLAAEDNPVNRKLRMAQALGLELTIAEHGAQALEFAQAAEFDLILMDCQMPVMDGLAATRALHESSENRGTPVIALTAAVGEHDHRRCLDAGMSELLGKPYTREELTASLRRWAPSRAAAKTAA